MIIYWRLLAEQREMILYVAAVDGSRQAFVPLASHTPSHGFQLIPSRRKHANIQSLTRSMSALAAFSKEERDLENVLATVTATVLAGSSCVDFLFDVKVLIQWYEKKTDWGEKAYEEKHQAGI